MTPKQIRGYASQLKGAIRADTTGCEITLDLKSAKAILSILQDITDDLRSSKDRPRGHRWCGEPKALREKSVLVDYYGHSLWLPKSAVVLVDGEITAPLWAIESAKEYNELINAEAAKV